jgi:hypothetical protein
MDKGKTDQDYFAAMFDAAEGLAQWPLAWLLAVLIFLGVTAAWRGYL